MSLLKFIIWMQYERKFIYIYYWTAYVNPEELKGYKQYNTNITPFKRIINWLKKNSVKAVIFTLIWIFLSSLRWTASSSLVGKASSYKCLLFTLWPTFIGPCARNWRRLHPLLGWAFLDWKKIPTIAFVWRSRFRSTVTRLVVNQKFQWFIHIFDFLTQ